MSRTRALPLAASVLIAAFALRAEDPKPTPTPRPKTARKLGGGSFGVPTSPTPAAGPGGGSLADIVRKTQESASGRDEPRRGGIVITNESLLRTERSTSGPSITITGTAPKTAAGAIATPAPVADYRDGSGRTESDWRDRAATARARAEESKTAVETARAEARRLENDFYAWSDGNYRERVIRPAWDQARERVKSLEAEATAAGKALDDLEEEARKSGAPPGWLR